MRKATILVIVIVAAASALRIADAFRPINQASWRECDLAGIARNFAYEGMNPLYPRVDWRGDGPGYTEMEFPLFPWLTAATYNIFGVHDQIGRIWALMFSFGAMFFFFKLAREYMSVWPSAAAFSFFAFHPLIVGISTSIQPEGLMLLAYLGAVYFFVRWIKSDATGNLLSTAGMTALAILAKAPAAHIGLFFGILLLQKYGLGVIGQRRVWQFGAISLLPAALWYIHAKNLWLTYGNSLGVSNEYHWIGWDFFTDPQFIVGILRIEFASIWLIFGLLAGVFAIWRGYREVTMNHALLWLASIFLFYIVTARTTSDDWAAYYHAFSIPPAALIVGFSLKKLWDYARDFAHSFSQRNLAANLSRVFVVLFVVATLLASFRVEAQEVRANFIENHVDDPGFVFARQSKPLLNAEGLIIVSGGVCRDPKGYGVAYNASYMFYWLDRKGWSVCVDEQSMQKVHELISKGAVYFVTDRKHLTEKPGFEDELGSTFHKLADSDGFTIYDLRVAN